MSEDIRAWGTRMAEQKQWLFHTPTFAIGPAEMFYDGEENRYISPSNDAPITSPVIELLTGHALVAKPEVFIELAEKEVQFYLLAQGKLVEFLKGAVTAAAQFEMPEATAITLITTLLRAQTQALEIKV